MSAVLAVLICSSVFNSCCRSVMHPVSYCSCFLGSANYFSRILISSVAYIPVRKKQGWDLAVSMALWGQKGSGTTCTQAAVEAGCSAV